MLEVVLMVVMLMLMVVMMVVSEGCSLLTETDAPNELTQEDQH